MNDKSGSAVNFANDLRDAAARNPVSAALIGMGVLWMLTGGRTPEAVGKAFRSARDKIPDAMEAAVESAGAARGNVGEYRRAIPDPGAAFDTVRENLAELFRAQPLALGVIGLAIGAGMAAALPKSDIEDSFLGEPSETVKDRAWEIASEQVEKVTTLANDVIDATSAEARKHGLTLDDAKAATTDISGRVGRVIDAVKSGVNEKQL
ncbi:MAG: hypothetical protein J0H38_14365 [Rhizobiales bacterium]|nr:hypothetical protein [Hyphomicrobiales bacterium]